MNACSTFEYIELVSETSTDYIYPQMVLDEGLVDKTQWDYVMDSEGNSRARMSASPTSAFVTAALYGRDHSRDSSYTRRDPLVPYAVNGIIENLDNKSSGLSSNINVFLIITISLLVMSIVYAVNRLPVKNSFKVKQIPNYGSV